MKSIKYILLVIPWILLLLALLLWSLGVNLPTFNKGRQELINSTVIIEKIEDLGNLELVRYNFKEIYDYRAISKGKLNGTTLFNIYDFQPDLKVILIAGGEAVGCIDLRNIDLDDIQLTDDTLYFRFPKPELCYYKLDMEKTRLYAFEQSGFWNRLFSDDIEAGEAIENAYREAEKQIKISALENGILNQTSEQGELILRPLLEKISGKTVVFTFLPQDEEYNLQNY